MSDLQVALIAAGVLALVLVWAYNAWQERKHTRTAETILKDQQRDALLPNAADTAPLPSDTPAFLRKEPRLQEEPVAVAPVVIAETVGSSFDDDAESIKVTPPGDEGGLANEPVPTYSEPVPSMQAMASVVEPVQDSSGAPGATGTRVARAGTPAVLPPLPAQWADSIADCILRFSTPDLIEVAPLWQSQRLWASDLSKSLHWLVFDPEAGYGGSWRCIGEHDRGAYGDWAIALQLVDRSGPVSDQELTLFLTGAQKYIRQMGGEALLMPDRGETLAYAAKLDRFCAEVDIQFSVHVIEPTGGAFAGSKLRGIAEGAGMVLETDGVFRSRDAEGIEVYTLRNTGEERLTTETIRTLYLKDLTLTLDVPRVADAPMAFDKLLATGRQLAKALNGAMVDAQGTTLEPPMLGGIRAKAGELQKKMRDGGINPGSVRALRLFS